MNYVKKLNERFFGEFSPVAGLVLLAIITLTYFVIKPAIVRADSVTDTYSDTSMINTGASSNYIVTNGQLREAFNTGLDGACTVSANANLNVNTCVGRAYADGVDYQVSSVGSNYVTTSSTPFGIAANDEILIIDLQGASADYSTVGTYEFLHVLSVSGTTITFTSNIVNSYGSVSTQKIMVQRVPNYTTVTINNGVTATANAFDGNIGGVVAFRSSGTTTVTGTISASALGYRRAQYATGESFCGPSFGYCAGGRGGTNGKDNPGSTNGTTVGGAGGPGGQQVFGGGEDCAGGGGGYGSPGNGGGAGSFCAAGGAGSGTNGGNFGGPSGNGGTAPGAGGGGGSYGVADLTRLFYGSPNGPQTNTGGTSGGGGIVYIGANTLSVTGAIQSLGSGAAGGSILISGNSITLGSNLVTTNGSSANGRIAVYGTSVSGTTNPTKYDGSPSYPSATIQSTDLITTSETVKSIDSFVYNLSSKPAGSTATIQFSQNATNWYSSAGVLNGTDTLSTGANNSISLATLNWSGASFYYKVSFGGAVSPILDDVKLNYTTTLLSPTIGTPTPLSTTSIQWNFTDHATDEVAFKVFDASGTWKVTCAGSNLSSCTESGLSAGTSYTRKVAASSNTNNDGTGIGLFSSTATASTFSSVPQAPTLSSGTSTTLNVAIVPGQGGLSTDTYSIYVSLSAATCNGTNGLGFVQANGTVAGSAVFESDTTAHGTPAWNTITVTGLNLDNNEYFVCDQSKPSGGSASAFGPASSGNAGYVSLGGFVFNGGTIANKYPDGNQISSPARYVYGVDNGTGTGANTAQIILDSGTLTVLNTDTLVFGTLLSTGSGTLVINKAAGGNAGAKLKPTSKLWVVDADADNYPAKNSLGSVSLYSSTSQPGGSYRRRSAIPTMAVTADCNDGIATNANQVHVPLATGCYADQDFDTYTAGQVAGGTATCVSASTCAGSNYYSASTNGATVTATSVNTMRDAANLSNGLNDCYDANAAVFRTVNGYLDSDGDGYGTGTLQSCVGATGNYTAANNTDCGPGNANAFPGSTYCGTASFTDVEAVPQPSYDYNCSNALGAPAGQTFCGNTYDRNGSTNQVQVDTNGKHCQYAPIYATNYTAVAYGCGSNQYYCAGTTTYNTYCRGVNVLCTSLSALGTQGCQ